jgi:hypothetical protein
MGRIGSPAAACSSPADSATGCSWTNPPSLVSRRIHRLLRVPPTGGLHEKHRIVRFFLGGPPPAGVSVASCHAVLQHHANAFQGPVLDESRETAMNP